MGPIRLSLPPQAELLFNHLRQARRVRDLGQDLIGIHLSTGWNIDVSWHPEYRLDGRFVVTVFGESWDQKVAECEFDDPRELQTALEHLAETYSEVPVRVFGMTGQVMGAGTVSGQCFATFTTSDGDSLEPEYA